MMPLVATSYTADRKMPVYVDGKHVGPTPVEGIALPAGARTPPATS